jgi:predicted metallopeptidase
MYLLKDRILLESVSSVLLYVYSGLSKSKERDTIKRKENIQYLIHEIGIIIFTVSLMMRCFNFTVSIIKFLWLLYSSVSKCHEHVKSLEVFSYG